MVVQTPTHVVGIGLAAIAPPGVTSVGGVGLELAVHIHHVAVGGELRHPFALFGQEAAVLLVAFPVLQICFVVRDVDVAAQHKLAPALQCLQMWINRI